MMAKQGQKPCSAGAAWPGSCGAKVRLVALVPPPHGCSSTRTLPATPQPRGFLAGKQHRRGEWGNPSSSHRQEGSEGWGRQELPPASSQLPNSPSRDTQREFGIHGTTVRGPRPGSPSGASGVTGLSPPGPTSHPSCSSLGLIQQLPAIPRSSAPPAKVGGWESHRASRATFLPCPRLLTCQDIPTALQGREPRKHLILCTQGHVWEQTLDARGLGIWDAAGLSSTAHSCSRSWFDGPPA